MNISIASDHAGFEQKTALAAYLRELGHRVTDLGPDNDERVDYPDFAALVARDVAAGAAERGVLVCGQVVHERLLLLEARVVAGDADVHGRFLS